MFGRTIMLVSLASGLIGLLVGCTHPTNGTTASVAEPAVLDGPAMPLRDWPPSSALYANGQVIADPTLWRYEPRRDLEKPWHYYFADTGAFLASVFTMPIGLFDPGAGADVTYPGRVVPPSHFAVPPLHKRPCKCGKPADQCGDGSCNDGSCKDGGCEDAACGEGKDEQENCSGEGNCPSCPPTTPPAPAPAPTTQPAE